MGEPESMSVEDWKALFRTASRSDLLRLKSVIDKIEAGGSLTAEDRGQIIAMFGRPLERSDVA